MEAIQKNFQPSLDKIIDLTTPSNYILKLDGHHLNNQIIELTKGDREYNYQVTSKIIKGIQKQDEIQFEKTDSIEFQKEGLSLFSLGKNIILQNWDYLHDEITDTHWKKSMGIITSLSTTPNHKNFDKKHLRLVIPTNNQNKPIQMREFQTRVFNTPRMKFSSSIIVCNVSKEIFHVCQYKYGEQFYIIIDSNNPINLNVFQKKCFNILLTIGVVTGNLIYDECYILSFEELSKKNPLEILYFPTRASVITKQASFTNNPMSVYYFSNLETDEKGLLIETEKKRIYEGMILFPQEVFSKIATLFTEQEKLQRAALIFIQSHLASLEIRIPNYYVAIEAITGYITKTFSSSNKNLAPIKDKPIADEFINQIQDLAKKIKAKNQLDDLKFDISILEKNINKLNAPPNADKLAKSFNLIGYSLSKKQEALLKKRNKFLHGSFIKTVDDDKAFREALHISSRVRFLLTVLILKLGGFSGKIINYAELWSDITEQNLGEERLIFI